MGTHNGRNDRRTARNAQAGPRRRSASEPTAWHTMRQAWTAVGRRMPRLRFDFATLASVQVDWIRMRIARLMGKVMAGSVFVMTLSALITVAATLLLLGATGGLATLLDDRLWLAALIIGSAALVGLLLMSLFAVHSRTHQRMVALYERYREDPLSAAGPGSGATPASPRTDRHAH